VLQYIESPQQSVFSLHGKPCASRFATQCVKRGKQINHEKDKKSGTIGIFFKNSCIAPSQKSQQNPQKSPWL
jgi:hypothetical protein